MSEYPISVRLPGYVLKKIDELIKKKEFRSRSDFIKFAVTMTLGQLMVEEAREAAKEMSSEDIKKEAEEARRKLFAGEFKDEENEIKDTISEIEKEAKKLKKGDR